MEVEADTLSNRNLASRLLAANPPLTDGIIPGSTRDVITTLDSTNGSKLRRNKKYSNVAIQELSGNRATLGGQATLVIRGVAKKFDGSDIVDADNISLREEAATLMWQHLEIKVNNTPLNSCERADVQKHVIDRTYVAGDRAAGLTRDSVPYAYRQYGPDEGLEEANVTTFFKRDIITDGKTFELERNIDDLPLFGPWGGIIPGFLSVTIDATLTSNPAIAFISPAAATAQAPFIEIEAIELRTRTVGIVDEVAKQLEAMWASGELTMDVDTWSARQIPPEIAVNTSNYTSDTALAFSSVPDVISLVQFKTETFNPSEPVWEKAHPLLQSWNGIKRMDILNKGECIKTWTDLDRTRSPAFKSVWEALETSAGNHDNTLAAWTKSSLNNILFNQDVGTGSLTTSFRNWGDRFAHDIVPMDLRFRATFDSAASVQAALYAVTKIRHKWRFSAVSGGTQLA